MNEEVHQKLELIAPLIMFFGLPEKEQIALLPVLEERKYDFPSGDLITSSALEVLVNGYNAYLNPILIQLMIMQDDSGNVNIEDLIDCIEQLLGTTHEIVEDYFEEIDYSNSLETLKWKNLRQLSYMAQQKLKIQIEINAKIVENCVEYWLHP